MKNNIQKLALILGVGYSILFWIDDWLRLIVCNYKTDYDVSTHLFSYNVPITTILAVYALELFFSTFTPPIREKIVNNASYLIIWGIGFFQLYLRLVSKSIDMSGHMTWAGLMIAHSFLREFPWWMHLLAVGVWLHAAYFNFILWENTSGENGTILGIILAILLVVAQRVSIRKTSE